MFDMLDKKNKRKFLAIKNGTETPASSGVAVLINKMKEINLPFYDDLLQEYKNLLEDIKENPPTPPRIPARLLKK